MSICFHDWGMISVVGEGAKRPSGWRVWNGGYLLQGLGLGLFSKIRLSKSHFGAFKKIF